FGFVTFKDVSTTKYVCDARLFILHGKKIECKHALKREDLTSSSNNDQVRYFRPAEQHVDTTAGVFPSSSTTTVYPLNAATTIDPNFPVGFYVYSPPIGAATAFATPPWAFSPFLTTSHQPFHPAFSLIQFPTLVESYPLPPPHSPNDQELVENPMQYNAATTLSPCQTTTAISIV
ncbi:unnamed protein product, partial [Didymodactylos carnosus]